MFRLAVELVGELFCGEDKEFSSQSIRDKLRYKPNIDQV
jgi:hypothetical protein